LAVTDFEFMALRQKFEQRGGFVVHAGRMVNAGGGVQANLSQVANLNFRAVAIRSRMAAKRSRTGLKSFLASGVSIFGGQGLKGA
jgi:hypothetical protein